VPDDQTLNHEELEIKLAAITKKIVENYKPEKIILFGSAARGDMNEDSDIDLFIVKNGIERERNRAYSIRKALRGLDMPPCDILVRSESEIRKRLDEKNFFISDIMEHGKVIYQK
jgi:uncharacterized protein